jgi:N-acetylneuraminic acid mutarotase
MPRRALEPGVAALGQQVVVAGGFDTSLREGLDITARVDAFDTTDGTWGALPDAPVRWTHSNLAVVGGTLYLVGGLDGVPYVARGDAFALDPLTHVWGPITPMDPADARGAAGVVTAPGRIYLLGGASSTAALATCLEYDIAAGRWTHLPDLPAPRSHPAAMRMSDGTLIVAGGFASFDASEPRGEVWALPPPGAAARTWQPRAAMHLPADRDTRGGCAYGLVLGELVCAGGEGGQAAHKVVESYAPYTDVWTVREPMPVERVGAQGAVVGGRLFIPGGSGTLTLEPTDTLYIYAPLDTAPR